MTVKAYCQLDTHTKDAETKKFKILLEGYSPGTTSEDTVEVGITGHLLRHTGSLFKTWQGVFKVEDDVDAGYGTIAELQALHDTQAALYFTPPESDTEYTVYWLGPYQPTYMRGPLDHAHVPFILKQTEGS